MTEDFLGLFRHFANYIGLQEYFNKRIIPAFGVPRLRGSDRPPFLSLPRLRKVELAAPEDFWTRLKAELRTAQAILDKGVPGC
jgi:hypothetical protein